MAGMAKGGSNRMLSAAELADMLGVSADTVYRQWKSWGLTAFRVGGSLRFRERHVEAWLEEHQA